jgi:hypothetical protein
MRALITCFMTFLFALSASAQLSIEQLRVPDYDVVYLGDLDPLGGMGSLDEDLTVTIRVGDTPFQLRFELLFNGRPLVSGEFRGSCISGTIGPISLSDFNAGSLVGLDCLYDFDYDLDVDFLDAIRGNTLPAGRYTVVVGLGNVAQSPLLVRESSFLLWHPQQLDLVSPFQGAVVFEDQPLFSWSGQAHRYRFRLCEMTANSFGAADAILGLPLFEAEVTGNSLIYGQNPAAAGATPLRAGERYVWQVTALVTTSSGQRELSSAPQEFTLSSTDAGPALQGYDFTRFPGLRGLLEGLEVTGPPRVDGRVLSRPEFQNVLGKLENRQIHIVTMRVE